MTEGLIINFNVEHLRDGIKRVVSASSAFNNRTATAIAEP